MRGVICLQVTAQHQLHAIKDIIERCDHATPVIIYLQSVQIFDLNHNLFLIVDRLNIFHIIFTVINEKIKLK